ncbi:MAG: aspartate aminotransferase family protein [Bacteroidales bacterium]|nr:aspartate aminotransferase family protein [Bacteroidales bacterium]
MNTSVIHNQDTNSKNLYDRACAVLPGGISRNTVFRLPHPDYLQSASGCYLTDVDGNEYIDFANNMAALIHGHTHPAIEVAVIEQLKKGTACTFATEAELKLAELLCQRVNGFEKIRFVNSGTEAVMAMIKAARAFTGRPKIAKAEGAYHGTYDFAEVSQTSNPSNWGDIESPRSNAQVYGTPSGVMDDVIIFPFNDIEKTIAVLDKNAGQIACVVIDPIPHRVGLVEATPEFIEAVFQWTRKNNALMVFDEVVTFRVNYGGAQQNYSCKPDLTALGKIIGGGFPVGAVTGRADIMKIMDPREPKMLFPLSGTFSANPITMTAGRVAMELFDNDAVAKLNHITQIAIEQIKEAVKIADVPVSITGAGSMFRIHLRQSPPVTYREAYQSKEIAALVNRLLDYLLVNEKIMMINTCSCMFSTVMTQKEVDRLTEGLLNGFRMIKSDLEGLLK